MRRLIFFTLAMLSLHGWAQPEHLQPASPGGTFDPAGYVRSMIRMKALTGNPRYIIAGHDARVYAIFPKVADGVVRIE
jgi:hypothetical protein